MAVNVGQRNVPDTNANRKSDAVDKCQHLCRHVLNLTANSKVLECPHADVAQRVRDLATDAYLLVFAANRIDTRTKDRKTLAERVENQNVAMTDLVMMQGLIPVAVSCFKWRRGKKETHIKPLSEGFRFLGFDYRMTETGKIVMTIRPDSVKHERRKLYRLVMKVRRGEITIEKADECYNAWRAHAGHGNSYQLLKKLDEYYRDLKWRAGLYAA